MKSLSLVLRLGCWAVLTLHSMAVSSEVHQLTPEEMFRQTVTLWGQHKGMANWMPWIKFADELTRRFSVGESRRLDIVTALEEGILAIEKIAFERHQGEDAHRDGALSWLYVAYARALTGLTGVECHELAHDPHTLLLGADTVRGFDTAICRDNAENSLRNAASLDATNPEAETLLRELLGEDDASSNSVVHKRKPTEFVEELFDSFADTFDETLLHTLRYRVPRLVGELAQRLLLVDEHKNAYTAVLDAGCGTGLAGRTLEPYLSTAGAGGVLLGVDASQKMLDKAAACTKDDNNDNTPLYHALLRMDLEDMTPANTLGTLSSSSSPPLQSFDLIVAADVLVYFGDLTDVFATFAGLTAVSGTLIFTCERATNEEAPLGWRLLPSGRFAHTKDHAVQAAARAGFTRAAFYKEIVPRMEKGEAVQGHLFGFVWEGDGGGSRDEL